MATVTESIRNRIFTRDGSRCVYCGSRDNLSIDHLVPESRGGLSCDDNLVVACIICNGQKADTWPPPPLKFGGPPGFDVSTAIVLPMKTKARTGYSHRKCRNCMELVSTSLKQCPKCSRPLQIYHWSRHGGKVKPASV